MSSRAWFHPIFQSTPLRNILCCLIALHLSSCGVTPRDGDVRETSLAYLHAFQRTAEDLAPPRTLEPLQMFEENGVYHVIAAEVALDRIAQMLAPQIPLQTLPPSWVGNPVSVNLAGTTPLDCLQQLAEIRGDQLQLSPSGYRIVETRAQDPTASHIIDRVMTIRHISVVSLKQSLEPFLTQENLNVRLAFSPETNQVALVGDIRSVTALTNLIAALDRSPPLCRIQAWVATRLELNELYFQPQPMWKQGGWDIDLAALPASQDLFQFENGEISLSLFSPSKNPGQESLQINAVIQTICQNTVAAPSMLCLSGQSALLQIGRTGYRLFTTPTSPTSSYITPQNITTGVTLTLTPKVLDLNTIDLAVGIITSKFSPSDQLLASTRSREAKSTVRLRKGDVIRLSGCSIGNHKLVQQSLSWFRSLPAVQWLFAAEEKVAQDTAVDFYVTVDIAEANGDLLNPSLLQRLSPSPDLLRSAIL